jgi:hypothetical protein
MPKPIRDKITANVQEFLQPGEHVQAVIPAQTKSGWLGAIGALWLLLFNRYRPVVVTDQRILITDSGKWGMGKPRAVVAELPRSTAIGPLKGLWSKCDTLGQRLYINKRFHKDAEQADAMRPQGPPTFPPPT